MIAFVFVTLDIIGTHSKNNVFYAMEIVKHVMDHILINVWLVGQIRFMKIIRVYAVVINIIMWQIKIAPCVMKPVNNALAEHIIIVYHAIKLWI